LAPPFTNEILDSDLCPLVFTAGQGAFLLPGDTCTFRVFAHTSLLTPGSYEGAFQVLDLQDSPIVIVPLSMQVR
jgi:hypothetical protein